MNTSTIRIEKIPPVSENYEENQAKNAGGTISTTGGTISTTGGTIPPVNKMPPVQNTENHAQISEFGGTGGINGKSSSK